MRLDTHIPARSRRSRGLTNTFRSISYSWTVPRPIEQLRAICRSSRPTSNLNLRTSLVLRTDNLLAGKRSALSWGGCLPLCCPAPLAPWKLIRRSRSRLRDRPKTVRLHPGFGVHLHPGLAVRIVPDWRSASSRNRVHVPPKSPLGRRHLPLGSDGSDGQDVQTRRSRSLEFGSRPGPRHCHKESGLRREIEGLHPPRHQRRAPVFHQER
jgi:hypothetical protein